MLPVRWRRRREFGNTACTPCADLHNFEFRHNCSSLLSSAFRTQIGRSHAVRLRSSGRTGQLEKTGSMTQSRSLPPDFTNRLHVPSTMIRSGFVAGSRASLPPRGENSRALPAIQTVRTTFPRMTLVQVHSWQARRSSQSISSVSKAATKGTNSDICGEEPFEASLFSSRLNQKGSTRRGPGRLFQCATAQFGS